MILISKTISKVKWLDISITLTISIKNVISKIMIRSCCLVKFNISCALWLTLQYKEFCDRNSGIHNGRLIAGEWIGKALWDDKLAPVALDILTVPASQAYVERIFSVCGILTTGRRNRMEKSLVTRACLKLNKSFLTSLNILWMTYNALRADISHAVCAALQFQKFTVKRLTFGFILPAA